MKRDIIEESVFETLPHFARAVVIAQNLTIRTEDNELKVALECAQLQNPHYGPNGARISVFDEVFETLGTNPKKTPPSVRQLADRVSRGLVKPGKPLPFINSVVAIMNITSLKHCVPVGGDDMDCVQGNFCLKKADGDEEFLPLGSETIEHPDAGEIVYLDTASRLVMCRRMFWRNGQHTAITTSTVNVLINIDGYGSTINAVLPSIANEVADLIIKHCGGSVKIGYLDSFQNFIEV